MTGPGYAVGQLLSDPTLLGMALLSTCVVHLGVWRATGFGKARPTHSVRDRTAASLDSPEFATLLGGPLVALVPFAAAMILVCLFLFMKQLGPVLIVLAAGAGVVSIGFLLWPLSARCLRSLGCARWDKLVTGMGATLVVAAWMFTGSWILSNVLAISLCVMITSFVRAGSLRVLSLLMGGLLCYDVVFVFVSPYMFGGRNVMVDVATAEPRNPFGVVSEALHLPSHAVQSLAFPGKLVLPVGGSATGTYTLLGLGDVLVPSLCLCYLRAVDLHNHSTESHPKESVSYYWVALPCYFVSVVASYFFSLLAGAAQPALLYIVPILLSVILLTVLKNGELDVVWNGPPTLAADVLDVADERRPLAPAEEQHRHVVPLLDA